MKMNYNEKEVVELYNAFKAKGLSLLALDENQNPVDPNWEYTESTEEDLIKYKDNSFGLRLGDQGAKVMEFHVERFTEEQVNKMGASLQRYLQKDISSLHTLESDSNFVQYFYWNGKPSKGRILARDSRNRTVVQEKGLGEYAVVRYPNSFLIDGFPSKITNEDLIAFYGYGSYFDSTIPKNAVLQEFNEMNTCSIILEQNGWDKTDSTRLGEIWETYNHQAEIEKACLYNHNRVFVFSKDSHLPHFQSLTASDLSVYFNYNGDYNRFVSEATALPKKDPLGIINDSQSRFKAESLHSLLKRTEHLSPIKEVFGEFWFEGELSILFGPTNTGKSTLAIQAALYLDQGSSEYDEFKNNCGKKKVLYFDLELSERQIHNRLKGLVNRNTEIIRVEFNPDSFLVSSTQEKTFNDISKLVASENAEVLIIDNLSAIYPNNEKASEATVLLTFLNDLKKQHNLSILVLAHTPKFMEGMQIELRHLAGSAQLSNLADSVFSINKTSADNIKYLKQQKVRAKEFKYGQNAVLPLEIVMKDGWLKFIPKEQIEEYKLLSPPNDESFIERRNEQIYEMYMKGCSRQEIESRFSIKKSTYYSIINKMKDENMVDQPPLKIDSIPTETMDNLEKV